MASKALARIVPARVVGTDVFRGGKIWPKVSVRYGKPIYFPKDEPITKEVLKNMTDEMMARIAELQAGVKNGN
jgi:1-acyl-sn-glycerol-3-phosphate acyltransferase